MMDSDIFNIAPAKDKGRGENNQSTRLDEEQFLQEGTENLEDTMNDFGEINLKI